MNPTQTLMTEHRLIEKVLVALESAGEAAADGSLDQKAGARILEFLRGFADRCHHGKEERHLFPRLAEHGYSAQMGPVAVMLHEHDLGRGYIRRMGEAIESRDAGRFAEAARSYVDLLRGHIQKEDQILFRIADSVFTDDDQREVAEGFERVELEEMGPGEHEAFHHLADEILGGVAT